MTDAQRELEPLTPKTLVDQAVEAIIQAAATGVFLPGDRVIEAEVARRLNVSRVPIREALPRIVDLRDRYGLKDRIRIKLLVSSIIIYSQIRVRTIMHICIFDAIVYHFNVVTRAHRTNIGGTWLTFFNRLSRRVAL